MSFFKQLGVSQKTWREANIAPAEQITPTLGYEYGLGSTTVSTLLGTGGKAARQREIIYEKWQTMGATSIISSGLKVLCTAALGGDPQTGQMVYLEKSAAAQKDPKLAKIAEEIADDLTELFNKVAYTSSYTAAEQGDSYVRIFSADKQGIIDLTTDELFLPALVQPYEKAGRTVGYQVYSGRNIYDRLDVTQLGRFKMHRTQWTPQPSIVQKSMRIAITENDLAKQPIMPSMVGGSFLYPVEKDWENLVAALSGITGQRIRDSLDEAYWTLNMENMTKEQQKRSLESVVQMLTKTKKVVDDALTNGSPILGLIRHIFPINGEKQIANITPLSSSRSATINVEDVLLHARLVAGGLGADLSNLGFADQMSAIFGDGGISRTSAQVAEKSRIIRQSAHDFYQSLIDVHTFLKYGIVFPKKQRSVNVNFYSSISAFDAEQSKIKADTMNGGMLLIQAMQMAKDLGWDKEQMTMFLSKQMMLEEEEAALYAKMVDVKPPVDGGGDEE